jgi:hypothetical protein
LVGELVWPWPSRWRSNQHGPVRDQPEQLDHVVAEHFSWRQPVAQQLGLAPSVLEVIAVPPYVIGLAEADQPLLLSGVGILVSRAVRPPVDLERAMPRSLTILLRHRRAAPDRWRLEQQRHHGGGGYRLIGGGHTQQIIQPIDYPAGAGATRPTAGAWSP